MSGVIKGIGKIFNAVVIKPIKAIVGAVKDVAVWAWHQPIIRMAAIAVAAYFTAGAALAYFAPAAGAGAASAASVLSADGAGVAGASGFAGTSAGIASGFGDAASIGFTTAGFSTVGAAASTADIAAFSGQAVGASLMAAGGSASEVAQATALASAPTGTSDSVLSSMSQQAGGSSYDLATAGTGGSNLAGTLNVPGAGGGGDAFGGFNVATAGQGVGPVATAPTGLLGSVENGVSNVWDGIKNVGSKIFGSGTPAAATPGVIPSASGGLLGDMGKAALIQGGLQLASALLQKPQPQMQYAGVNAKGQGAGLGIHTINGGFGLATGGGEPAPGGVPDALKPGGSGNASALTAGAYSGASLSNAGLAGSSNGSGQPGNLGQTAANAAGVGGLVPQGAVNYMGTPA
jgi:hypothetical protein